MAGGVNLEHDGDLRFEHDEDLRLEQRELQRLVKTKRPRYFVVLVEDGCCAATGREELVPRACFVWPTGGAGDGPEEVLSVSGRGQCFMIPLWSRNSIGGVPGPSPCSPRRTDRSEMVRIGVPCEFPGS